MTEQATTQKQGKASKILASVALLALAAGVLTVTSLALFTDQEKAAGNAFSTGTIDLVATPASAVVTMPNLAPGDQITRALDVRNSGSLEFRYAVTSSTTEDVLASELVLTVKSGVASCTNANWNATGSNVYSGILGSTATIPLWGSSAQGDDPGDRVLAAGANEVLCVNVTLPLSTPNSIAGRNTSATFTFDAEQTANNP
ncbi:MAG: CalY family protein [Acidimicrobiia bacterium]|nr:CalY family protein [Acidimicrobiia bacterium]